MDVLILERDKLIRDQILVGLQNFPEFAVDLGEGFGGLNMTKQKDYHCVVIGTNLQDDNGMELVETFCQHEHESDLVLVTTTRRAKSHQSLRARYDVFSILYAPLDPREFFRLVARLRRRGQPAA